MRRLRPPARAVRRAGDLLVAVLLAPRCAACAAALDAPLAGCVCPACWAAVTRFAPPLCRTCGDPVPRTTDAPERCARCRRLPTAVDASRAAGEYEGALRAILHAFKYDGRRTLAAPLGALARAAAGDLLEGACCAVPVPLHPLRRLTRGFNQAADLAGALGLPVVHALRRVRATAPQTGLSAGRRRQNVSRAFALARPLCRRGRRGSFDARTVVLVDDVRTTGATLHACAQVLKAAGVREVRALTVARAMTRAARRAR